MGTGSFILTIIKFVVPTMKIRSRLLKKNVFNGIIFILTAMYYTFFHLYKILHNFSKF